jgi:deoxyribonuclease IV
MYIGGHISKSGGYLNAIKESININANCVQLMTGSPQKVNFPLKNLTEKDFIEFNEIKHITNFKIYIHSPYVINLCNPERIYLNTKIIIEDLIICDYMNGLGVVIHTGSKKPDQTIDEATKIYIKTIKNVLNKYKGKSKILLETSAGQGNSIGVSIKDFANIYNSFTKAEQKRIKLVIDTCHLYVAGYDISTKTGIINYFIELSNYLDLNNIELIHLNDSKIELGKKVDRHENLGKGYIFKDSFETIELLKGMNIPMILETRDSSPYNSYKYEIELVNKLKEDNTKLKIGLDDKNKKKLIIDIFCELAKIYYKLDEKFKADAYYEVIYRLKYIYKIPQTKDELMKIDGIGEGISTKILEILETNKLKYLDELKNSEEVESLLFLLDIPGIGSKKALELSKLGIKNYNDLDKAVITCDIKLTKSQKLGYLYYKDLNKKIPRTEATKVCKYLQKKNLEVVGSYRRGNKLLKDIDILGVNTTVENVIKYLQKKYTIVDFITKGTQKSSFLMIIDKVVRRIDLLITSKENYYLALLYFTGSKYFNIEIRTIAKQKGYRINEYHLTKGSKKIKINSEEDIFTELGIDYIAPENR